MEQGWLDFWQRTQSGAPTSAADFFPTGGPSWVQGWRNANPQYVWGNIVSSLAPNQDHSSPLGQYLRQSYPELYSNFVNAAALNPTLTAPDFFGQQAGRLQQRFGMQSAQQRGERPDAAFAGRPNNWG